MIIVRCPKASQRAHKRKTAVLRVKPHFTSRKSATKFLCVKTVSDKVVKHLLACLFAQKWFAGDDLSKWKFERNWPTAFKNADFQSIFDHNASTVKPSENS